MPFTNIQKYFTKLREQEGKNPNRHSWHQLLLILYLLSLLTWTFIGDNTLPVILNMSVASTIGVVNLFIACLFLPYRKEPLALILSAFFAAIALWFLSAALLMYLY